jgi:DNA-binding NarL/FixJ family response regulator
MTYITGMTDELMPGLAILDLHMSGGSGFGYLERLQGSEASPHVAVLTNDFGGQYRKCCLALGAVAFPGTSSQFGELGALIQSLRRPPQSIVSED